MNRGIENIRKTRTNLITLTSGLTAEQLNKVPAGFNNNLIWNLAHVLATQQGLCYGRAGQKMKIDEKYFMSFKTGTRPDGFVDQAEIDVIRGLLSTAIDQFEKDYADQLFSNYPTWTTGHGFTISNIDEAINFVFYHEGLHTGYCMALKRLVI